MRKIYVSLFVITSVAVFSYCSSSKKAASSKTVVMKTTYADVAPILMANCTPCHFPDKGGRKKALDTYTASSTEINDILRRIQLAPGTRGFMPDRHAKLSDSTIAVIKKWQADGLTEK